VFAGSYWEACARLVQQVAATMAYVHEQGIVHRDLKPSNIVVTKQGQALVLDFGLAHVRDLQRVTHDDKPLGTPAYVSPEQVRGEAIDERVDVYGLGVTLYELLTTHLPFENESWESLQSAILAGSARPVRSWNRAIPRDLEIVCAMAIDRDRARRYRSMADFAADLEAVLARRPIRARPLGPGLRLVRFAQRHPAWAATAGALLVVALQFPLLLWQQEAAAKAKLTQANQELGRSNRELAEQRRIAVDNYNDALDAVQQVLVGSAQGELVVAPGNERTQLAILRRAEAMYERLREKRPDHRRLAFDSARNLQHIGNQLGRLGDVPGAEAAYRDALLRCAPWNGADFHYLRGSIARFLGIALERRGARDEAVAAYEQAHCELAAAWPHFPGDRVVRRQFAEAIASLGKARQRTDPAGALALLQQAQTHKEALLADEPRDLAGALACALGCSHLADLLAEREPAAAEAQATRGIDILSTFPPTGKEEGTLRQRLAGLHDTRGTLREAAQRPAEAEQDHGCALALRAGLAHDFPAVAQYRFEVACSRNNLAMVQRHLAGSEAAATLYGEALADFEQAVRMAPTNVEFGRGLVAASQNHAQLLLEMRRLDELAEALGVLGERSKEPPAQLAVARLALQLARQLTARDGEAAAGRAAHWRERAVDCIAAAIASGWRNRAHFETSGQARAYDDLRTHDRFLDLLDTLPTAGG
jgi:tetratricopeptide (TPR) repeat protein